MITDEQLNEISNITINRINELFNYFGFHDYKLKQNKIVGRCPIHGGDNDQAFNLWVDGNQMVGNWKCRTHGCERIFKKTVIGLTRGLLSKYNNGWVSASDKKLVYSFRDTVDFLLKFNKISKNNLIIDSKVADQNRFIRFVDNISDKKHNVKLEIPRNKIISSLRIPSDYFVKRGYNKDILVKYDVGECIDNSKEMKFRSVVPIYDEQHRYCVGCTGRSLFEQCKTCKMYHYNKAKCPNINYKGLYTKWRHNAGFKAEEFLYNYWFAKDHIKQTGVAILVESPGVVWKLVEAGIENCVAIFGTSLNAHQSDLLNKSGAMRLIVLTDPDDAGILSQETILENYKKYYSIVTPKVIKDIDTCSKYEIQKLEFLSDDYRNLW